MPTSLPPPPPPLPLQQPPPPTTTKDTKTLTSLLLLSLLSLLLLLLLSTTSSSSSSPPALSPHHKRNLFFHNPNLTASRTSSPTPPGLAYFLTASNNDTPRLLRLLLSIYHPKNSYLLHLDLTAPQSQRDHLALWVQSHPVFGSRGPFHNVYVVGKADFAYRNAPSSISSTLHGASLLLRFGSHWDWFLTLSAASDYPLVTQDDLLHIFSYLPKNFNFMNHSSDIGLREFRRMKTITVDPGLYLSYKSELFYATQKRELPNAFRLFTGSPSAILSREFVEFCIMGSNNLPRTILMYLANTPSQANYFPTVLCNTREFKKTIINYNLHFASWTESPKREKHQLGLTDLDIMIQSGSAFGSGFAFNDTVLDHIDQKLLNRKPGSIVPGGWCLGETDGDSCTVWGDTKILRPGPGAQRLEKRLVELLSNATLRSQQCALQ